MKNSCLLYWDMQGDSLPRPEVSVFNIGIKSLGDLLKFWKLFVLKNYLYLCVYKNN